MRLGVYADLVYRAEGETLSTDRSFVKFVTSLPPRVDEVVLFGRLDPRTGRSPYAIPEEGVRFVPFPHYARVTSIGRLLRALPRTRSIFEAELERLDAVWIFGPHPLALELARIARRRGTPLFLGIRQDYRRYIGGRLPSRAWLWAVPAAHALDLAFRRLARDAPTVAVGAELGERYRRSGGRVLITGFSLVPRSEIVPVENALARSWDGGLRVLSVGRLDPEKNPLLLAEVLAGLRRRHGAWRLAVAGEGPLAERLSARIAELGLEDAWELLGYVPNGPRLWQEYRRSHAFLHVSHTEGLPQVLFEAQAAGLPIVGTDVGGVRAALGHGRAGLLVPADDPTAAVDALERLRLEPVVRRAVVSAGHELVRAETLEDQLDRVAEFFRQALPR